jgi:predicted secreted acid phosphatase
MIKFVIAFVLLSVPAQSQQAVIKIDEPEPNLGELMNRLTAYHHCGEPDCYVPQLNRQGEKAVEILKRRVLAAKAGEKLALVLDIDETALSNWADEMRLQYGYTTSAWDAWVKERACPAIEATLRLYQEAEKEKVAVFFITGRPESERADTAANLKSVGYTQWDGLAMRADQPPPNQPVEDYKSVERVKIVAQGYTLILNVGDQMSDLDGNPQAEQSVKLPNPFYYIP